MERTARNYAPGEITTDEWEAVMEAGGRNYAPGETTTNAVTRNSALRAPLPPPIYE
ncbi:MAG: hypothetical protein IJQ31_08090 [Thermoguttaceae bacterium]|nr:hypothetical protein [Thermoguttaceae bacterium]